MAKLKELRGIMCCDVTCMNISSVMQLLLYRDVIVAGREVNSIEKHSRQRS
jgi:hypothetical protein